MANQIMISPDEMRARAAQYDTEAGKVSDVISQMDSLLSQLQEEWKGEASAAYGEKFGQLRPGFVNAQELITDIANALRATAQSLENTDSDIAGQFRQ